MISERLKTLLGTKGFRRGDQFPSIRKLSQEFACSATTMHKALEILQTQGLLSSIPRKGYFVSVDSAERLKLLAAIVVDVASPTWASALRGIEDVAHAAGHDLIVASHETEFHKHEVIIRRLIDRQVSGFILTPSDIHGVHRGSDLILKMIMRSGAKVVFLDRMMCDTDFRIRTVGSDNVSGAYRLTSYLIQQGHRRILFVQSVFCSATQERWLGYRLALTDHGLPYDESLIVKFEGNRETLREETMRQLEQVLGSLSYSAVFSINDNVGMELLGAFHRMGKRVPEDVSLVSYDARELSTIASKRISGISQPFYEMGRLSASVLLQEIEGRPDDKVIRYNCEPEMQVGDTVRSIQTSAGGSPLGPDC